MNKNKKMLFGILFIVQILGVLGFLDGTFLTSNVALKVLNYFLIFLASYYLFIYTIKKHINISLIQKIWMIWLVVLFIQAIPAIMNPYNNNIALKLFFSSILFTWLIPLLMFAEPSIYFYKKLIKLSWLCVVAYALFSIIIYIEKPSSSESLTFLLGGSLPLLLMTLPYHSKKKTSFIIFTFIVVMVLMMLVGRRNKFIYYGSAVVIAIVINVLSRSRLSSMKKSWYVFIVLLVSLGLYFTSDTVFSDFFLKMDTGMESRETVIELFIDDFNRSPKDWVFGRGLYGQVDGGILNNLESDMRDGIENGYLYLVLKAGGLWLFFFILTALPAMYRGFFCSQNILCKGLAGIILIYFIDMIGYGLPGVSLKYVMVYISIAGCNTKWMRHCSDNFLAKEIGLK